MKRISLEPTDTHFLLSFNSGFHTAPLLDTQPRLSYRVRYRNRRDCIDLSTGEAFQDLEGVVHVFQKTGDDQLDSPYYDYEPLSPNHPGQDEEHRRKVIGSINYVPPGDDYFPDDISVSYDVRVLLPKVKFDELLMVSRLGHLPSAILIRFPDDTEGWTLHGGGGHEKWDNKAFPQLDVVHVDFIVPLISQAISKEQLTPSDQASAPTRSIEEYNSWRINALSIMAAILLTQHKKANHDDVAREAVRLFKTVEGIAKEMGVILIY